MDNRNKFKGGINVKKLVVVLLVVVLLLAMSAPAFAFGPGGAPKNHPAGPLSGREWGGAVSDFAKDDALGFAGHIVSGFAGR